MPKYPFQIFLDKLTSQQKEVLRFLCVGILCLSFNTVILVIAIKIAKLQYLIATVIGFFFSNLLGFLLNKYFTFRALKTNIWQEIYKYYSVMGSSFFVNLGLMAILVDIFKIDAIYASLIIAVIMTTYNYLLHKKWSFKLKTKKKVLK